MSYIETFSGVSHTFSKDIKNDDSINHFSYMLISSGTLFEVFFDIIMNTESDQVPFSTKNKFIKNLNSLKKEEVKKIYKIMLYEYFSFVEHFMDPLFKKSFPVPFEDFERDFKDIFVTTEKELLLFNEISDKYDSAFHSRLILKHMKLPKNQDDVFLVETLEELKKIYFHRFNETIVKYIKIRLRGGDSIAKKLRKM